MAIEVKIIGDSSGIVADVNKTKKSVLSLNQGFQLATGVATLAFSAFEKVSEVVGDVLKIGIEFEQSMADLRATIGGLTTNEFKKLNEEAEKLGSTTRFSAGEAAKAMQELARAGFNVNEILEVTGSVLNTASAAGTGLAFAANIVAGAFKNFERTGISANEISDLLAKTANSSRQTFEQLASAVDRSGAVASQFGIEFAELTQIFGAVADAGFRGEVAATALNGALVRLGKETPQMKKVLDDLGLSFSDIDTSTNSFREILDNISESGASAQQIIQLLGQEAGPKLVKLFSQGSKALDEFKKKQDAANSASESAAIRNDTLQGKLKELNSAYEALAIAVSKSFESQNKDIISYFTIFLRFVTESVKGFNKIKKSSNDWAQEVRNNIDSTIDDFFSLQKILSSRGPIGKTIAGIGNFFSTTFKKIGKAIDDPEQAMRILIATMRKARQPIDANTQAFREQERELKRIAEQTRIGVEQTKRAEEIERKIAIAIAEKTAALKKQTEQMKAFGETALEAAAREEDASRGAKEFARQKGAQIAGQVVGVSGAIQGFQAGGGPAGAAIGALTEILLSNKILNEQIGRLNEAIVSLLDPIITALIPLFDATISILNELKPLFEAIGEQLGLIIQDLQPILEELSPLIRALVDAVRPLTPILRKISPALIALARVSRATGELIRRMTNALSGLDQTTKGLNTAIDGLKNAIENLTEDLSGGDTGLGGGGGIGGTGIGAGNGGGIGGTGIGPSGGFAQGGLITKDRMTRLPGMEQDAGLIMAHKGERVVSNNDNSSSVGNINITINAGIGSDGRAIANMLREELEKLSLTRRLKLE